jgi:hypothetical protein
MRGIKQAKPSPAFIVAVVALVAALGGGAVAGVAVNSLNKKETKKVRKIAKKQANKAVKGIPAGPKGDTGGPGPKGDKGDPGATNVTARSGPGSALVAAGGDTSDIASCNPGEVVTGGGYFLTGNATHSRVYNNLAEGTTAAKTQWHVSVYNDSLAGTASVGVVAQVFCSAP